MPSYVITALLTYFVQYKKLVWGGRNYVEKQFLPCIMCVQYRGGAQYRGGVQYRGGIS